MDEQTKMIQGEWYDASDSILSQARIYAKDLIFSFNQLPPSKRKERRAILSSLLHTHGYFQIESPFQCDYGIHITIGENFFANHNCIMLDCAPITIGNNVLFGPNVALYTAGHPLHPLDRRTGLECAHPITIEDDVWIGGSVVVNPGVRIGQGAIIGSGSVVTKDIPANVIAVGNPARILRTISKGDRIVYENKLHDE